MQYKSKRDMTPEEFAKAVYVALRVRDRGEPTVPSFKKTCNGCYQEVWIDENMREAIRGVSKVLCLWCVYKDLKKGEEL